MLIISIITHRRFGLTDKEGSADRKVPIQPLVFTSKDGSSKRYNLRKVISFNILMFFETSAIVYYPSHHDLNLQHSMGQMFL